MDSNFTSQSPDQFNAQVLPEQQQSSTLKKLAIILITVITVIAVSIGGYLGYKKIFHQNSNNSSSSLSELPIDVKPSISTSWQTFTSTACYVSFQYPAAWVMSINREKNDTTNHYCVYKFENENDSSYGIAVQTIIEDDLKVWVNALYSLDVQTPVQISNADKAIRIETLERNGAELKAPIVTYGIQKGKKIYALSFVEVSEDSKLIYKQIVDSFQFTGNKDNYTEQFRMGSSSDAVYDTRIKNDIIQIRNGLLQYYADKAAYPFNLTQLVPEYILELPKSPIKKSDSQYRYESDYKTYYVIRATLGSGEEYILDSRELR